MIKDVKKSVLFFLYIGSVLERRQQFLESSYQLLYHYLPYKESSIRGAVSDLIDERMVIRRSRSGYVEIELTNQGRDLVLVLFPGLIEGRGRREDRWNLLVITAEGDKAPNARSLTDELQRTGWIHLQRSVFVYPGKPPEAFKNGLVRLRMMSHVVVSEIHSFAVGDERTLLARAYPLTAWEEEASQLSDRLRDLNRSLESSGDMHHSTDRAVIDYLQQALSFFSHPLHIAEEYFTQKNIIKTISAETHELARKIHARPFA